MNLRDRMRRRLRALFSKTALDREMDEEMRLHMALESEELVRAGMSAEEAVRQARLTFGGAESHKETARDNRGVRLIEDLVRDVRYTAGALRRSPGFAATTIVTLAIGISATTLVFSAVYAIFLRRLPVRDAGRVFVVQELGKNGYNSNGDEMARPAYPYEHFVDFAEATPAVFAGVAASTFDMLSVRQGPYAHDVSGVIASSNYFSVLGVQPALGRFFAVADERTGSAPAEVVLGYDLWQREFQGDSAVLGRALAVDSRSLSVVGVAPKGFEGTMIGLVAELWVPAGVLRQPVVTPADSQPARLRDFNVVMFGRLRTGVSVRQAQAKLAVIGPQLPAEHLQGRQLIVGAKLDPISGVPAMMRGSVAAFFSMLMLTGLVVLLIAIANVAGMLLARGAYRRREIAMRLALGATRGRLMRQLLTESILLCTLGACGGLLLARWLLGLLPAALPPVPIKIAADFTIDPVVFGVTLGVAVLSGIITGLNPALQSLRTDLVADLHGSAQGQPARLSRARDAFVVGQLALSLVLLITAGLFTRALERATNIDPGFDARKVVAARVDLSDHGYTKERGQAFYAQLLIRLRARPEIAAATFGIWTPLGTNYNGEGVYLPGEQPPHGRRIALTYGVVDAEYLDMMHVPLVAGRSFAGSDAAGAPPVIIVNETLARRFWPGETPLGRTITVGGATREVIGVVRDGKYRSLDESPENYAFVPYAQRYNPSVVLFARARGDSTVMAAALRREVAALDPNVALEAPESLSSEVAIYLWPQQAAAAIVGVFGAVGLLLAIVGVYGIVSYHVGQRTREFGIRLALGAERATLVRLVLGRSLLLIAFAVGIGATLALAITSLAHRFLFGLGAADPMTFGVVPLLLAVVAITASYLPARRATKIDPVQALRTE